MRASNHKQTNKQTQFGFSLNHVLVLVLVSSASLIFNSCKKESESLHYEDSFKQTTQNKSEVVREVTESNNILLNPCFEPISQGCQEVKNVVNDVVSLPGYCDIEVTYSIWNCNGIFTISDLNWNLIQSQECTDWYDNTYNQCLNECMPNPSVPPLDPFCIWNCTIERLEQLEVDLHWYILDQYIRNGYTAGVIVLSSCAAGPPYTTSIRFFRDICLTWCAPVGEGPVSIYDITKHICGDGCCKQGADYCLDENNNVVIRNSYVITQINCDPLPKNPEYCESIGLTTLSSCKPASCD